MLTHIGIKNLRSYCLEQQLIELKKINLFVGKNSSGKSTFLRIFPLLRQSLETETLSPILWFGKYVDFGDIDTVKNDNYKKNPVTIQFKSKISNSDLDLSEHEWFFSEDDNMGNASTWYQNVVASLPDKMEVISNLNIITEQEYSVQITIPELKAELIYLISQEKLKYFHVKFDGYTIDLKEKIFLLRKDSGLFPDVFYFNDTLDQEKKDNLRFYISRNTLKEVCWANMLSDITKKYSRVPKNIHEKCTLLDFKLSDQEFNNIFANNSKVLNLFDNKLEAIKLIKTYSFGTICNYLLKIINQDIDSYFKGIRYVGPIRANSDRYYRYQGIQINELDHTGSNLPMILQSLKPKVREDLSTWIYEQLDFHINLVLKDQHYAIEIKAKDDDKFHNITDMGFGYSQILPIAVTIWFEIQGNKRNRRRVVKRGKSPEKPIIFTIEQPELHLHPSMQYDFGIMISKLSTLSDNLNINVILETHSKAIIDAISNEIYDGRLNKEYVGINLFQKNNESQTVISEATFDSEGYLLNWPAGFLSVGDK